MLIRRFFIIHQVDFIKNNTYFFHLEISKPFLIKIKPFFSNSQEIDWKTLITGNRFCLIITYCPLSLVCSSRSAVGSLLSSLSILLMFSDCLLLIGDWRLTFRLLFPTGQDSCLHPIKSGYGMYIRIASNYVFCLI
jgi:hypothetical protein